MPDGGGDAEAALEALQPLGGEGDFWEQDQGLAVLAEGFGDGLQVGLGLAGAGDAVEQGDGEFARLHRVAEGGGGGLLVGGEGFARVFGVGDGEGWGGGEDGGEQQAGVGHASDYAGGDAGGAGEVAGGAGFGCGQGGEDFLAGFGDAGVLRRLGGALPAGGWRGDAGGYDAERHCHHFTG